MNLYKKHGFSGTCNKFKRTIGKMKIHARLEVTKAPNSNDSAPFYNVTVNGRTVRQIQLLLTADDALTKLRMRNCRVTIQDIPTSHTQKMQIIPGAALTRVQINNIPICFCTSTWLYMGLPESGDYHIRIYRKG